MFQPSLVTLLPPCYCSGPGPPAGCPGQLWPGPPMGLVSLATLGPQSCPLGRVAQSATLCTGCLSRLHLVDLE